MLRSLSPKRLIRRLFWKLRYLIRKLLRACIRSLSPILWKLPRLMVAIQLWLMS